MERYDDCLVAYRDLIRNSQDEYEEERKTNLSAVVAAQSTWERVMPVSVCLSGGVRVAAREQRIWSLRALKDGNAFLSRNDFCLLMTSNDLDHPVMMGNFFVNE